MNKFMIYSFQNFVVEESLKREVMYMDINLQCSQDILDH